MSGLEQCNTSEDTDRGTDFTAKPELKPVHPGEREFFIRQAFNSNSVSGYELLFRHYYGVLCSHAIRYVYTKEIAEDLVSEVFYSFWQRESYKSVRTSFRAYLFEAVRHRCFNYLKWEFSKDDSEEVTDDDSVAPQPRPDQIMEFDELCIRIEKTIESLPPQCRNVFIMHRFDGKTYPEISKILNISVKAVEAHISKALTVFRKTLIG